MQNPDQNKQKLLKGIEEAVSAEKKDSDRILSYLSECDQYDIEVLPLDINKSDVVWTFETETGLRIGFSALVCGGSQFLEDITAERRDNGDYQSFQDFCERIDLEIFPEEFLSRCVASGAFDSTEASRAQLFQGHETIIQAVQTSKAEQSSHQISLFEMVPASSKVQLAHIPLPDAESWTDEATIAHEKNAMGFSFTEYLLRREDENTSENVLSEPEPKPEPKPEPEPEPEPEAEPEAEPEPEAIPEPASEESQPGLSAFIIQFQASKTTEDMLIQLQKLIERSPGDVRVMLEFIDEKKTTTCIKTHHDYSVDISEELIQSIEAVTGEQTTRISQEVLEPEVSTG